MYSSSDSMQVMVDKLSSVALGDCIFEVSDDNRMITCSVTDDVNTYPVRALIMNDENIWVVNGFRMIYPKREPTHSYIVTLGELVDALKGKGYDEGIEFLNQLSGLS